MRIAGVNIGVVKSKELSADRNRTVAQMEIDPRYAPLKADTRAILRLKSLLGETYVELSPGSVDGPNLPDGGRLPDGQIADTVELDEIFSIFDRRTRRNFEAWLRESGIAFSGDYGRDLNSALGNAAPFFEGGADLLKPLDEQEVALRRLVRNTGRVLDAIHRAQRPAPRPDRQRPTHLRCARLPRPRAGRHVQDPAHLPARDPGHGGPARALRGEHRPAGAGPATARPGPSPRRCVTWATSRPTSSVSSTTSSRWWRPRTPASRRRSGSSGERSRCWRASTSSSASSTRSSPTWATHASCWPASSTPAARRWPATRRAAIPARPPAATSTTCPQSAIIDGRSLQRRVTQPTWERANAYVAPNAYQRAIGLGVIESFQLRAERRPGATRPAARSTPSRRALLPRPSCSRTQKYPRLLRGRAPLVPAPVGREGNRPAVP